MDQDLVVGKNIKLFRKQPGLSQQDVAEYIGEVREAVSYYETGSRSVPTGVLSKLSSLFGVDEYDLFVDNPESNQVRMALAFRTQSLDAADLNQIAGFRKIVLNYLQMKKKLDNESIGA